MLGPNINSCCSLHLTLSHTFFSPNTVSLLLHELPWKTAYPLGQGRFPFYCRISEQKDAAPRLQEAGLQPRSNWAKLMLFLCLRFPSVRGGWCSCQCQDCCEDKWAVLMGNTEQLWAGEFAPLLPVSLAQYPLPEPWHHLLPFLPCLRVCQGRPSHAGN